jgi:hypothetical protein
LGKLTAPEIEALPATGTVVDAGAGSDDDDEHPKKNITSGSMAARHNHLKLHVLIRYLHVVVSFRSDFIQLSACSGVCVDGIPVPILWIGVSDM